MNRSQHSIRFAQTADGITLRPCSTTPTTPTMSTSTANCEPAESAPVDLVPQAAGVLSFGTHTGTTEYWNGALREVRIYSRKLGPTEIAELYGTGWSLEVRRNERHHGFRLVRRRKRRHAERPHLDYRPHRGRPAFQWCLTVCFRAALFESVAHPTNHACRLGKIQRSHRQADRHQQGNDRQQLQLLARYPRHRDHFRL